MQIEVGWGSDILTDDEKKEYKYAIQDYKSFLVITWRNGARDIQVMPGEPEDASFYRDLSWVKPALERAYSEGLNSK